MADRRYPHPMPREGIAASIAEIAADAQELVRLEVALARQEIMALVKSNAMALGLLAGAALCALFMLFSLVTAIVFFALSFLFHRGMGHDAIGFLVVFVIWTLAAGVLALLGKSKLVFKMPEETIKSLKDDVEWAKQQIRPATR